VGGGENNEGMARMAGKKMYWKMSKYKKGQKENLKKKWIMPFSIGIRRKGMAFGRRETKKTEGKNKGRYIRKGNHQLKKNPSKTEGV